MLAPALIYLALNAGDPVALDGWAIPAVTDIAFALAVLSLVGKSVPLSLRIFLLTLAILDDLAAIAIIAVFYSGDLSLSAIFLAVVVLAAMIAMNRAGVASITPYALAGILLWVLVLKSGVHATLAGVATGFMIPFRDRQNPDVSPLKALEYQLHPWVANFVMPSFAFANAGLAIGNFSLGSLVDAVPTGIIVGLVAGKPAGIFGLCWLAVKAGITSLPADINFRQLFGVSILCGIGFTMSLFISSLAFEHGATQYFFVSRLGILVASAIAATLGYFTLRWAAKGS
jgi:NhaA family Na+:H+ antiporter